MKITALLLAVLMSAATAASATVTPLPGSTPQYAPWDTPFPNQIGVLVTDANDVPVPGATVRFSFAPAYLGPFMDASFVAFDCRVDAGWNCRTITGVDGVAILPGFYASILDHNPVRLNAELGATFLGNATIELERFGFRTGSGFKSLQDMWWSGVAENGWGMSVVEHGAQLFNVIYAYDAEGKPTWWVMPAGTWRSGFMSTYDADLYSPRSAPYFAYDGARFVAGIPAGKAEMRFSGPNAASLGLDIGGIGMRKEIQRMTDIGTDSTASNHGVGDMWWGGAGQSGWGVAIIERNGVLFSVWLTYDADGKPTWLVMPGGSWSGNAYSGQLIRTQGAVWVGTGYDASKFGAAAIGTYTLRFADAHNATLEYSIDGHSGSASLVRQAF